ncbi:MAG: 50S ribosomal protein L19 [Deltaproteobacteria bacterium]|jgi:large subunit ribosomal protein L19|nr:50S ribosomal protein L19 [Deltaproteobacteria bacterium]
MINPPFGLKPEAVGDTFRQHGDILVALDNEQKRLGIPLFKPGDTVAVHARIKEGEKERIQVFKGVVIRIRRGGMGSTFTVRKVSYSVGVERIFPFNSPAIDKVEIVTLGRVRRAKLYYLRKLRGKAAKVRTKNIYAK